METALNILGGLVLASPCQVMPWWFGCRKNGWSWQRARRRIRSGSW